MIPKISHFERIGSTPVFVTTDGVCGTIFRTDLIDAESSNCFAKAESFRRWLNSLSPDLIVRVIRLAGMGDARHLVSDRASAMTILGFRDQGLLISIECQGGPALLKDVKLVFGFKPAGLYKQMEVIAEALEQWRQAGLGHVPQTEPEIQAQFFWERHSSMRVCSSYIETGGSLAGTVRLIRQASNSLDFLQLTEILSRWSFPFRLTTSLRRVDRVRREMILRTRLKQEESGEDRLSVAKAEQTGEILEDSFLRGTELFEFEMIVTIEALSESELKTRLQSVQDALAPMGDVGIETFGCLPTLAATMPGSPLHVPLFERDDSLAAFLPICAFGEGSPKDVSGSLLLHREDRSLSVVDILSKSHTNANSLVIGQSGKGKSVFTGLLTTSLLASDSVRVIKLDVGGSHRRECELQGGIEFDLALDQPSGLNPFSMLNETDMSESTRAILGKFIEVLVMEDGEDHLPKTLRVEIDELLQTYLAGNPPMPSLDGFYRSAKKFSRSSLLGRWCGSGLYGKAFQATPAQNQGDSRLRYYNFSQIFHAADKDFAQAGMAAVLAQFNLEVLKNPDRRIVLICDETPFFINSCFDFFKFSMGNVRKFGASIVLIVQLSQHLVKDGDTGLLDNAYHRFLFTKDGVATEFKARLGLSDEQMESLDGLSAIPGVRSEVLYQCGTESSKLLIELTPEEYWRVTSSQADRIKIQKLRQAVPELTLKEALQCIARIG